MIESKVNFSAHIKKGFDGNGAIEVYFPILSPQTFNCFRGIYMKNYMKKRKWDKEREEDSVQKNLGRN